MNLLITSRLLEAIPLVKDLKITILKAINGKEAYDLTLDKETSI